MQRGAKAVARLGRAGILFLADVSSATAAVMPLGPPPGVVTARDPDPECAHIGTPATAILPDGTYVAAHDYFGKNPALVSRTFWGGQNYHNATLFTFHRRPGFRSAAAR